MRLVLMPIASTPKTNHDQNRDSQKWKTWSDNSPFTSFSLVKRIEIRHMIFSNRVHNKKRRLKHTIEITIQMIDIKDKMTSPTDS